MKTFWIAACLLVLTAGCGISKEDHHELMRERDALRDQVTIAETENGKLKKVNEVLVKDLIETRTDLEEVIGEKGALREEYDRVVDDKISLKNERDRLLREKQVLESHLFELERKNESEGP